MEVTKRTFVSSRHISPYPVRIAATFEDEFDHLIDSLGIANVRISLFALTPTGWSADELLDAARRAFSRFSLVGRLPDGSIAILYLGPRPTGMDADRQIEDDVIGRLAQGLHRWTIARTRRSGGRPFDVRVAHCWSDEIDCATDMLGMLETSISVRPSVQDRFHEDGDFAPTADRAAPWRDRDARPEGRPAWLTSALAAVTAITAGILGT